MGAAVTATDAGAMGLINYAVPADQLDHKVYGFAETIAAGASQAIRLTKRAINTGLKRDTLAMMDAHLGCETKSFLGEEHRNAVGNMGGPNRVNSSRAKWPKASRPPHAYFGFFHGRCARNLRLTATAGP